jgi:F0F1-type ATP synthase membrane subunit b/b'
MNTLLYPFLNFAALFGFIAWKTRKPFAAYMKARRAQVAEEFQRTAVALADANARQREFDSRLKGLSVEIEALRNHSRQDAEAKRLHVLNDAKRLADQIVSDARLSAEQMVVDFRAQLVGETAQQVIHRAERALKSKLTGDDRVRFAREFSHQLERKS